MRPFLMSTAALVFLTLPALSQPGTDRGDRSHGASQSQDRGQAGPHQAAPQQQSTPFNRGHNPEQHAAPVVQPQAAAPQGPQNRGDRGRNAWQGQGGDHRAVQQAAPVVQPQATIQNRSGRGNTNFANRPGGQNFGNRSGGASADRGARRDFSSFRDYHRTFNASRHFRAPAYRRPSGWYDHRWSFGEILPGLFWGSSYWLTDYSRYDLPPPPYGTVWVREGRDALLIDRDSGEIITVEYDVFY
jgi:Ni/Co efflux regulator RcnB